MADKNELSKKINGTWTIAEIIEAMKAICPEAWIDESKQSQYNTLWKRLGIQKYFILYKAKDLSLIHI